MAADLQKAQAPADELVNPNLIKAYIWASLPWLILGPIFGLMISIKFNYPDWLGTYSWLSYPRLRMMHVNGVALGWYFTGSFGMLLYMVPRLCQTKLWGEKLAWAALYIWGGSIAIGEVSIMLGYSQPLEVAELPIWSDILNVIAVVLLITVIFGTILKRKEKQLYVSLWYATAALIWTALNYIVGNIMLPYFVAGTNSAAFHGFYLHNVVGLMITPLGVSMAYYFLPVSTGNPLYSHRLSMIGFWTIAFLYPFTGTHHYLFSPIADWVQTLSITASILLIIPVWTVVQNFFGTMVGKWSTFTTNNTVRFLVLGIVFYLATCFQGPTQALRSMQRIIHFTDWVVGHAHLAVFGVFTLWLQAAIYHVWPRLTGHKLYSQRLATWHYWLTIMGFGTMALVLWGAGLVQGTVLAEGPADFVDTVAILRPYWMIRTLGGAVMDMGIMVFVWNMYKTYTSTVPFVEPDHSDAAAVAQAA